jgi:diguanylate cyclase (GGDEF)-like protein
LVVVFAVGIWMSYQPRWRRAYRITQFVASVAAGAGTVAVIEVALWLGHPLPYEGILLVPLFIYLIICLPWWQALVANGITLASFIATEFAFQPDAQARLYQIVFLCAANAIAAYGGYFLEYTTRSTFLVHALLNELAERDGLTGLYNRRSLNSHLERIWRQGSRDGRDIAIAMIDVDRFKQYNDRFGHARGDAALKAVAEVIASMARRPLDLAARYGGEEFVLAWYHPIAGELQHMGDQLLSAIAALDLAHPDSESTRLSISVGIACALPAPGGHWAELLQHADGALFQAKADGRNRVVALADCAKLGGQHSIHEAGSRLDS